MEIEYLMKCKCSLMSADIWWMWHACTAVAFVFSNYIIQMDTGLTGCYFHWLHSLWYVPKAGYIIVFMKYSVLDMLQPLIVIIMQDCSQALETYGQKSGGVSKCLLSFSIRECLWYVVGSLGHILYLFCNKWGCMCSTEPFYFRW